MTGVFGRIRPRNAVEEVQNGRESNRSDRPRGYAHGFSAGLEALGRDRDPDWLRGYRDGVVMAFALGEKGGLSEQQMRMLLAREGDTPDDWWDQGDE